jgi:UDP-2,3-diacylglucosamine pyrophosphatase LpxH
MNSIHTSNTIKVKTVFISDVHLGFPGCSVRCLLNFLRNVECEKIYLVGDIIYFGAVPDNT